LIIGNNKKCGQKWLHFSLFTDIYIENISSMKKIIRLTESDLHRIVKESVRRILREGGTHEIEYGCGYTFVKTAGDGDYVYDNYGEDMWREYVKWCIETNFFPVLFGYGYGSYEDGDITTDEGAMKALEEELTKLDSCPLFSPEQIEDLKNFINNDVEDKDNEWQVNENPNDD
jgi:hypothetical protein